MSTQVLVYDLPSENQNITRSRGCAEKVRNTRVMCTYRLHSLGLQCTESVILISPSQLERVDEVVTEVENLYMRLREETGISSLTPIIRILGLTQEQQDTFTILAKRRLLERIDETIDRVTNILNMIDEMTDEARRRQLRYRLNQLEREWTSVSQICRELGIDVNRDLGYLLELIITVRGEIR